MPFGVTKVHLVPNTSCAGKPFQRFLTLRPVAYVSQNVVFHSLSFLFCDTVLKPLTNVVYYAALKDPIFFGFQLTLSLSAQTN